MGRSDDPFLLAGESGYDEREVLPGGPPRGRRGGPERRRGQKLGLHFWCGDYAGAAAVADEAIEHIGGMAGTAICKLIYMISALSRIQRRAAGPLDRPLRAPVTGAAPQVGGGRTGQLRGTVCADPGSLGAGARAAPQRRSGYLDRAIELAEEHQLPLIGALAHEEAATLYAQTGRATLRRAHAPVGVPALAESGYGGAHGPARAGASVATQPRSCPGGLGRDRPGRRASPLACAVGERGPRRAWPTSCSARLRTRPVRPASCSSPAKRNSCRSAPSARRGDTTTVDGPWTEVPMTATIVRRVADSGSPLIVAADSVGPGTGQPARVSTARRSRPSSPFRYGCRTRRSV